MALPDYFLQELKMRSDLPDIASSYVNLKRKGKNMVGLCPFHNEKTPSFNIYTDNGSFYCFGCQAGGDVITFVMKIENLDYMEAVRFLAQRAGLNLPEDGIDDGLSKLRTRILEINRATARFFHETLLSTDGKPGLDYLKNRGMDSKTIRRFGIGYAPEGGFALVNHLKNLGYTKDEMTQANVSGISRNGNSYDRFRGRVMFPIIDLRGNVIAFGGRILTDEKPKYINTSDTPVYHKSSGLFAMNIAKNANKRQIILAEGYMDVIALHRAGFTNAVASLGTSFTGEQARVIAKYADEAVICYDSDEAGQRAAMRAIPILKATGLKIRVLAVPGNKDPDEFMKSYPNDGMLRFQKLLDTAPNDIEYKLTKIRIKYDTETVEGKSGFIEEAIDMLGKSGDIMKAEIYAKQIAQTMEVSFESVKQLMEQTEKKEENSKRREERKKLNQMSANTSIVNTEKRQNYKIANAEEGILAYLFKNPDEIQYVAAKIPSEKFVTAYNRRVYKLLLGKTIQNEISLMDFSQDLTTNEMAELSRIVNSRSEVPSTREDVQTMIEMLQNAKLHVNPQQAKDMSKEELAEMMKRLKKEKLGE
ncbi:DNA primase [Scatolibacter rhodanostii]|uniref:DNA primase n=1 Tax=Scatolibacter rhodanostii TaxID=2014781 RepID=UPI000C075C7F|nr:DNA primase [Scatolibacter rhodanostii]